MAFNQQAWDTWFNGLDETTKDLINERFHGLENTVRATRQERDTAQGNLDVATKKANFFETAHSSGCQNPKVAFALATTDNLFKEDGSPDWEKIKSAYPEGFKSQKVTVNANAGAGNSQPVALQGNDRANNAIREAAGKTTR